MPSASPTHWTPPSTCRLHCITLCDQPDIVPSFLIRRNGVAVLYHGVLSRVIACQRQIDSAIEHLQKILQIARAGVDTLSDVVWVCNSVTRGGSGHKLH